MARVSDFPPPTSLFSSKLRRGSRFATEMHVTGRRSHHLSHWDNGRLREKRRRRWRDGPCSAAPTAALTRQLPRYARTARTRRLSSSDGWRSSRRKIDPVNVGNGALADHKLLGDGGVQRPSAIRPSTSLSPRAEFPDGVVVVSRASSRAITSGSMAVPPVATRLSPRRTGHCQRLGPSVGTRSHRCHRQATRGRRAALHTGRAPESAAREQSCGPPVQPGFPRL